jgi:hypothetical protein
MKSRLHLYLDEAYFEHAIKFNCEDPTSDIRSNFFKLLQSTTSLFLPLSRNHFDELCRENPFYKGLLKKELENQLITYFDVTLDAFIDKTGRSPAVIFCGRNPELQLPNNILVSCVDDFESSLNRLFVTRKFKLRRNIESRRDFLSTIKEVCSVLSSDQVVISDAYLFSGYNIKNDKNLIPWLKSVTSQTRSLFIISRKAERIDVIRKSLSERLNTAKCGILTGWEHNRYLLTRFFFITSGHGFNCFRGNGTAKRNDEFQLCSIFMPKSQAGDVPNYQLYLDWLNQIKRQLSDYRNNKDDSIFLEGDVFFEE